jgi:hypothetical protein
MAPNSLCRLAKMAHHDQRQRWVDLRFPNPVFLEFIVHLGLELQMPMILFGLTGMEQNVLKRSCGQGFLILVLKTRDLQYLLKRVLKQHHFQHPPN